LSSTIARERASLESDAYGGLSPKKEIFKMKRF